MVICPIHQRICEGHNGGATIKVRVIRKQYMGTVNVCKTTEAPTNKVLLGQLITAAREGTLRFTARGCSYKTQSTTSVLFRQHPIFTSNPESARDSD